MVVSLDFGVEKATWFKWLHFFLLRSPARLGVFLRQSGVLETGSGVSETGTNKYIYIYIYLLKKKKKKTLAGGARPFKGFLPICRTVTVCENWGTLIELESWNQCSLEGSRNGERKAHTHAHVCVCVCVSVCARAF